jgi:D-alanyl-D-alanine carboxypeptidase
MGIRAFFTRNFRPGWRSGIAVVAAGAVLAAGMSGLASAQAMDERDSGRKQLQRDADALLATGASGVLVSVTTPKGQLSARSGVADLRSRRQIPWDAYYRIASTTKPFVATVMLQLVGEGRLSLDDRVERWLPGLVRGDSIDGREITVRQVLQHTSGIPEYSVPLESATTPEEWRRERFRTFRPEELVARALREEPSEGFAYSNTNYVVAGMILEKVTGNPWQQEVHDRIIEPLDLRHTIVPGSSAYLPEPRLSVYKQLSAGGPQTDVSLYAAGQPDYSMISTTDDVGRFFRALLGGKLLRPAELREMQRTVPAGQYQVVWRDAEYGLGLMKRKVSCGDGAGDRAGDEWVWFHGGGVWNALSDNVVTSDGRTSAAVAIASTLGPDVPPIEQYKSSAAMIDNALCATR